MVHVITNSIIYNQLVFTYFKINSPIYCLHSMISSSKSNNSQNDETAQNTTLFPQE